MRRKSVEFLGESRLHHDDNCEAPEYVLEEWGNWGASWSCENCFGGELTVFTHTARMSDVIGDQEKLLLMLNIPLHPRDQPTLFDRPVDSHPTTPDPTSPDTP